MLSDEKIVIIKRWKSFTFLLASSHLQPQPHPHL
jgi:hypothetical protein